MKSYDLRRELKVNTDVDVSGLATEATLAGVKAQTDLLTFTDGKLDVNATVSLTTNTNLSLVTEITQSITSVELLAEDLGRISFYVRNDSDADLYISLSATATTTDVIKLLPGDVYFEDKYTGVVSAIWGVAGSGNARVLDVSPNVVTGGLPVTDGLQLWLDATDETTITKDGSDFVSAWTDKSDNAYSFSQLTASSQPQWIASGFGTENKPYLSFDGVDDFLQSISTIATNTNFTTVQVWKIDGSTMLSLGSTTNNKYSMLQYAGFYYARNNDGYDIIATTTNTPTILITDSSTGDTINIYENGNLLSSTYNSNITGGGFNRIGLVGSLYANGKLCEVLFFNKVLTSEERTNILNYLNTKYGIY